MKKNQQIKAAPRADASPKLKDGGVVKEVATKAVKVKSPVTAYGHRANCMNGQIDTLLATGKHTVDSLVQAIASKFNREERLAKNRVASHIQWLNNGGNVAHYEGAQRTHVVMDTKGVLSLKPGAPPAAK